ncbi:MAG: YdeI/OmpD-associated family protein [Gelidibacter sp.]
MKNSTFRAKIEIIGINPFVFVPDTVLRQLFDDFGKTKGQIPVKLKIDGHEFTQTLVKYSGHWRLYLNAPMRNAAKKEVGDSALFELRFDPEERITEMPNQLGDALRETPEAKVVFDDLTPSRKKEIMRYISNLKTQESIDKNVKKAIDFLLSKGRFIGRDKP